MKMSAAIATLFLFGLAGLLVADTEKAAVPPDAAFEFSDNSDSQTVTPDMKFYLQEWRRHDGPARVVRLRAERRAEQRRQRLAVRKWFGYSKIRPQTSVAPWTKSSLPLWHCKYYPVKLRVRDASDGNPGSIWK